MGDSKHKESEQDQDILRARARERIDNGVLPRDKATRTWGGRGSGLHCSLCEHPILASDPEMELEFDEADGARAFRFHLQCHSVWDSERRLPAENDWISMERSLPALDAPVEARVLMGPGRTVILGVVRVKDQGGSTWLNSMTHAPLPAAWSPIEWRYPIGLEPRADQSIVSTPKRA